jgi:hypothetical protein
MQVRSRHLRGETAAWAAQALQARSALARGHRWQPSSSNGSGCRRGDCLRQRNAVSQRLVPGDGILDDYQHQPERLQDRAEAHHSKLLLGARPQNCISCVTGWKKLQALLGVGSDDVSRLLAVLDATPQQCEMIGFMLRRSVATRTALHTCCSALGRTATTKNQVDRRPNGQGSEAFEKPALKCDRIGLRRLSIPAADEARLRRLVPGEAPAVEPASLRERCVAFLAGT